MLDMDIHKHRATYRARFTDHRGIRRKFSLAKNRRVAETMSRQLMQVVDHAAAGVMIPDDLLAWVQSLNESRTNQLKLWGLIDDARLASASKLGDNMQAWKDGLIARGRSEAYARQLHLRVSAIAEDAGFNYWRDIDAERVLLTLETWRQAKRVPGFNRKTDISEKTLCHYLQAFKQFCKWWVAKGHAAKNPMATVPGELRPTKTHATVSNMAKRRPLSGDERSRLVASAQSSSRSCKASGPERALLYRTALQTGLRASAIRRLMARDVDPSGWLNASGVSDNKKSTPKPVRGTLLADLVEHASLKHPDAPLFTLPRADGMAEMLRRDAADAGIELDGVDFHCLRHSFGTALARKGVHPKTLMSLMDHATIQMTMKLYTHSMPEDEVSAMELLADPKADNESELKHG